MTDPRGSNWRRWDLHVHTPASHLNNQFADDWDIYVQILFKKAIEKQIWTIGITDYFTIDGYNKIKTDYIENPSKMGELFTPDEITIIQNILLLPNIEFRLNKFVGESSINFHVIFSENLSIQDIEENFLHNLDFVYTGTPQSTDERYKLTINNLEALGRRLKEEHEHFRSQDDLTIGMINAVVDDLQISEVLDSQLSRYKGKYLMGVVADEDLSEINWNSQDHQARKILIQKSDFLFSSNPKTREWAIGKPPYMEGEDNFIKEFKTLKPCIHGSDAHKEDEIGHPCIRRGTTGHDCIANSDSCELRYCWIKGDTTFEGLKQLLYEPSARVIIHQNDPTPLKSNYTIERISLSSSTINDELSIQETNLVMNSGLIAVTGSKGSGKTALVDIIANCYIDRCNTKDRNSFVRRVADQNPTITARLAFKNGSEFSKQLTDNNFFEESPIIYVSQGELEKYIGDESDLDKYVRELIFESPHIKDTVENFEFLDLADKIQEFENYILKKNAVIEKLEKKTDPKILYSLQLEVKQRIAELKDIRRRIQVLEKGKSSENVKLAHEKEKILTDLKNKKTDLVNLKILITENIRFIEEEIPIFNKNTFTINALLKKLKIQREFPEFIYEKKSELNQVLEDITFQIIGLINDIDKFQKDLNQFEAGIKEHTNLLDRKRAITVSIRDLKVNVKQIEKEKLQIATVVEERKTAFKELVQSTLMLKKKYEEIIEKFSDQKADVLSDLDFNAKFNFISEKYLKTANDVLDKRKVTVNGDGDDPSVFDNLLSIIREMSQGNDGKIDDFVDEIIHLEASLKSKIKSSEAITIGDFYDFLYGNYYEVIPVVKYKNTNLNKLSLGQKATVLIKIYLAQGDKPIIIDSHDDHLDNEFIMDELVNAIREAKSYRQVILVSNNGNVVINSDAEQIVMANRNDTGAISYDSGSIENPEIRDRALKVLEGGLEAFRKRQQKYRISI